MKNLCQIVEGNIGSVENARAMAFKKGVGEGDDDAITHAKWQATQECAATLNRPRLDRIRSMNYLLSDDDDGMPAARKRKVLPGSKLIT